MRFLGLRGEEVVCRDEHLLVCKNFGIFPCSTCHVRCKILAISKVHLGMFVVKILLISNHVLVSECGKSSLPIVLLSTLITRSIRFSFSSFDF